MLIDVIGWIGALLLATCSLPQVIKTLKTKKFDGLSITFLFWWAAGEVFTMYYIIEKAFRWPLILNYSINLTAVLIMIVVFVRTQKKG